MLSIYNLQKYTFELKKENTFDIYNFIIKFNYFNNYIEEHSYKYQYIHLLKILK